MRSPARPSALKRTTASRSDWRSRPTRRAASARLASSNACAIASARNAARRSASPCANRRKSAAPTSFRITKPRAPIRLPPFEHAGRESHFSHATDHIRVSDCGNWYNSSAVIRDGCDDTQPCRQPYRCKACSGHFDDLTGTVLAGHHHPLRVWVLCLYFMGLNLSNRQIALELGLDASDTQAMTEQLRAGLAAKAPAVELQGEVEPDARAYSGIDEVYVVAGHKGQPAAVAKRGGLGAVAGWQAHRDAARWKRTSRPSSA